VICRLAIARDEAEIVEMAAAGVAEAWAIHHFEPERYAAAFRASLVDPNPTFFVAEGAGGKLAGFLEAYVGEYNFTTGVFTVPHVTYVRPEKRGTRAAALLIGMFVRWSDKLGAKENIGGNSNGFRSQQTARFLKRFGYEEVGICMKRQPSGAASCPVSLEV